LREDKSRPIDYELALKQHHAYVKALRFCVSDVVVLPAEPDLPDACFVEDTAVLVQGRPIITRPGAESRRPETAAVERLFAGAPRIESGFVDGGDVMVVGSAVFVGLSGRTDAAGIETLRTLGLDVRPVPVNGFLHLKTRVTPIGPETLLQVKGAFPRGTFGRLKILETEERLGGNVLAIGKNVLVSTAAPRTAEMLADREWTAIPVDLSEFHAGDAGVTCLSLIQHGEHGDHGDGGTQGQKIEKK
jgi:dimethylargininase